MATFLARGQEGLDPATRDWFDDDDTRVHEDNIHIIAENGITIGFGDGTYRPNRSVTRGQMTTFLTRALGLTPIIPPVPMPTTVDFFLGSFGDDPLGQGPFVAPVHRRIEATTMPATATMRELLERPTIEESESIPALVTEVPPSTELRGPVIADGVAAVDLSGAFASRGGSASRCVTSVTGQNAIGGSQLPQATRSPRRERCWRSEGGMESGDSCRSGVATSHLRNDPVAKPCRCSRLGAGSALLVGEGAPLGK